ncbi:hypothetical protein [Lentibacter sp. XHP0401]|uniref:hypothetical protein n=1 Tax=Lentibacter sp. XHP0401 TaxID=2984334 RepID=UPI0021E8B926|nr:hypothetical protein [Lentibacter sp. XHP0401]MCV2893061.1 hypothetical protein [Lentibacter sp. XHP0401]
MQNAQARRVLGIVVAIVAVLAALAAMRSGLDFAKHETDMLHLVDIVLRLEGGARLHEGVMTPLGLWSVAPFVMLKQAGLGLGAALKWGQIAVAALLIFPAYWVGVSRMRTVPLAAAFGAAVLLLAAGMVYGGDDAKLSLSMHYNRWAWAIVFPALALVILPAGRQNTWADAAVIGAAMAALVLVKVTYFVAFAPAVILGLLLRGQGKTLGFAVLVGLGMLAVQTLFSGFGYWQAYLGDLLTVAASEVRPQPGQSWAQVMLSPAYAAGTLLAMVSVLWLRSKHKGEPAGLILALVLPGAIYVSYQNFGNDPLWLVLWGLMLLVLARGQDDRRAMTLQGALALAFVATPAINIAVSPLRHLMQPAAVFEPLVAQYPDLRGVGARFGNIAGTYSLIEEDGDCTLAQGAVGYMRLMAERLEQAGLAGEAVYAAGLFNTFWLYGDFTSLKGGAPWYYGGLPGIESAGVFVLPECSFKPEYKELVMRDITKRGIKLEPVYQDELLAAFRLQLP